MKGNVSEDLSLPLMSSNERWKLLSAAFSIMHEVVHLLQVEQISRRSE